MVREGGSVTLEVEAAGNPAPAYQWFHNGKKIPGAISNILTLSHMRRLSGGRYYCEVTNAKGKEMSRACTITVSSAEWESPAAPSAASDWSDAFFNPEEDLGDDQATASEPEMVDGLFLTPAPEAEEPSPAEELPILSELGTRELLLELNSFDSPEPAAEPSPDPSLLKKKEFLENLLQHWAQHCTKKAA